jgi:hypothetical protein
MQLLDITQQAVLELEWNGLAQMTTFPGNKRYPPTTDAFTRQNQAQSSMILTELLSEIIGAAATAHPEAAAFPALVIPLVASFRTGANEDQG